MGTPVGFVEKQVTVIEDAAMETLRLHSAAW